MLQEEIEAAKASEDSDLLKLAQDLLSKINEQSSGEQNITVGDVKATGDGSIAVGTVGNSAQFVIRNDNNAKK